jgi:hypothetical protein
MEIFMGVFNQSLRLAQSAQLKRMGEEEGAPELPVDGTDTGEGDDGAPIDTGFDPEMEDIDTNFDVNPGEGEGDDTNGLEVEGTMFGGFGLNLEGDDGEGEGDPIEGEGVTQFDIEEPSDDLGEVPEIVEEAVDMEEEEAAADDFAEGADEISADVEMLGMIEIERQAIVESREPVRIAHFGTLVRMGLLAGTAAGNIGTESLAGQNNLTALATEGLVDSVVNKTKEIAKKVAGFVSGAFSKVVSGLGSAFGKLFGGIKKLVTQPWETLKSVGRKIKAHPMKTALTVVAAIAAAVAVLTLFGGKFPVDGKLGTFNKWNAQVSKAVEDLIGKCPWIKKAEGPKPLALGHDGATNAKDVMNGVKWKKAPMPDATVIDAAEAGVSKASVGGLGASLKQSMEKAKSAVSGFFSRSKDAAKIAPDAGAAAGGETIGVGGWAAGFMSGLRDAGKIIKDLIFGGLSNLWSIIKGWFGFFKGGSAAAAAA